MDSTAMQDAIYKRIALRAYEGFDTLAKLLDLDRADIVRACSELEKRGLVTCSENGASPIRWWREEHLELLVSFSTVDQDVFHAVCDDVTALAAAFRSRGYKVVRPQTHETSMIIIAGTALIAVAGLFAKSFLEQLAKSFGEFAATIFTKYRAKGISKIEVTGTRQFPNGDTFTFNVTGDDPEKVCAAFHAVTGKIGKLVSSEETRILEHGSIEDSGNNWRLSLGKKTPGSPLTLDKDAKH
ncbi:MAG: hypothetical protein WA126_02170 [Thermodesulfovibrionales bacterium]